MSEHPRQHQVASVLRRAVQQVIDRGLADPRVRGLISVTEVRLSPDGHEATVMISIHPPENAMLAMHGIRHASRYIRTEVAGLVKLRRLPRFIFREDQTIKQQNAVLGAISRALERSGGSPDAPRESVQPGNDEPVDAGTDRAAYAQSTEPEGEETDPASSTEETHS